MMRQRLRNLSSSNGRRDFLMGGVAVGGALATQGCATSGATEAASPSQPKSAGFGWEIINLNGNGADVYFKVLSNMVLNAVDMDVAAMILSSTAAGFAEVLCSGGVSRQAPPTIVAGAPAYNNFPASPDFGSLTPVNPSGLNLNFNANPSQDEFLAIILKTWVPADGTASATSRHASAHPGLTLNAGDFLVFHMDHLGIGVDAEMQVILNYSST